MRYFKLTDGLLEEYCGPQMGAAWFAANRYLPYAGMLGVDWLCLDQGEIRAYSEAEYAALHPASPKRYSKLRIVEQLGSRWPQVEAKMTEHERAKFLAAEYLESGRDDVELFLAALRPELPDLDELLARCEI